MTKKKKPAKRMRLKGQWLHCEEHLPEPGRYVITYSEIYGTYNIAYYRQIAGWYTIAVQPMQGVTHWCDMDLPLYFKVKNRLDEDMLRSYGLQMDMYGRIV